MTGLQRFTCALTLAASCFLGGCGYQLAGRATADSLIAGKSLAIPMWSNKSYRPNLEAVLTGSLIDEFAGRTGGRVVPEGAAELILSGSVVSYYKTPVSYTAADQIKEYRSVMTIEALLTEKSSRKVLWKGSLQAGQDYPTNADLALQQNSEEAALHEIGRKLARQLYQKITENF
jgi:outer membrane lipopolysaccharide assembly protein LptE/RlpB